MKEKKRKDDMSIGIIDDDTNMRCVCMCMYGSFQEGEIEETGWKLVHGDVFRPPRYPLILSALVGSGVQVHFVTTCIVVAFDLSARYTHQMY